MRNDSNSDPSSLEPRAPTTAVPRRVQPDPDVFVGISSSATTTEGYRSPTVPFNGNSGESKARSTTEDFRSFRDICNRILQESKILESHMVESEVDEKGLPSIIEIEDLLENLFDCNWGEDECLQRIAVAVETQVKNTELTEKHVSFLIDFFSFLKTRYHIDESIVQDCIQRIKQNGLDPFRGTLTETEGSKRYKVVEFDD